MFKSFLKISFIVLSCAPFISSMTSQLTKLKVSNIFISFIRYQLPCTMWSSFVEVSLVPDSTQLCQFSIAMEFIFLEVSYICVEVSNNKLTFSLHITVGKVTFILEARIIKNSFSIEFLALKIATIHSYSIRKKKYSFSFYFVILKLPFIKCSIKRSQFSFALLFSIQYFTLVECTIFIPVKFTYSSLLASDPVSFIFLFISQSLMSKTMSLVQMKTSLVLCAVRQQLETLPLSYPISKPSFILSSISTELLALSVRLEVDQISNIDNFLIFFDKAFTSELIINKMP